MPKLGDKPAPRYALMISVERSRQPRCNSCLFILNHVQNIKMRVNYFMNVMNLVASEDFT